MAICPIKAKSKVGVCDLEIVDDKGKRLTSNDQEKAEVLSEFFSSVFTLEPEDNIPTLPERNYQHKLTDINITRDKVIKKLLKIKTDKSPGSDEIHPRALKESAREIPLPLEIIFNSTLKSRFVPKDWKVADVTTIFKKGKRELSGNYRPVSLTSVVCKIMESIIRDGIIDHMKQNNLFSKKQFGFISGCSTVLQMLHVMEIWTSILDERASIDTIYCDYMKAFDKVPHKRLINKLSAYGLSESVVEWIKSFLSDRTQQVVVNGQRSAQKKVTSGIPQGSILGPILFIIYINDLPETLSEDTNVFLFADDTKIFRKIEDPDDCDTLQRDISEVFKWSEEWLLKFHPQKCSVMRIGNEYPPLHSYKMNIHTLEYSKCEKDIGIFVDNKLKFDTHTSNKINKANKVMGVI